MIDESNSVPASACIVAQSERQALDWSLVLTSQEISSTLVPPAEGEQWVLVIEESDRERALAAIHQYQLENAGWTWRQQLPWSGIIFHWGALFWAMALICFHALQTYKHIDLRLMGCLDSVAVRAGQWWRLFTAVTLHADAGHLAANTTTGLVLLGLAMARFGAGAGLLAAFLAGACGNVLGAFLDPLPHRSLGASGMVMGALGLVAIQSLTLWRSHPRASRLIISGVMGGSMLFILMGLDPQSDVLAHLGGFLGGLALGGVLALLPPAWIQNQITNTSALLLLSAGICLTWYLALTH